MPQRNFYIIGHNPNSLEDVEKCFQCGVNAIEPDIDYHDDMPEKFYVHEDIAQIPNFIEKLFWNNFPSLKEYLTGLKKLIKENNYDLKMIVFDLKKEYSYDINGLYKVIRENFSDEFPDIKILTTMSDPDHIAFMGNLKDQRPNEAMGLDENTDPEPVYEYFKNKKMRVMFAAGSSLFSTTTDKFVGRIERALKMRDEGGFSLVYPWCVNSESHMREFLELERGIDGMLTDQPNRLRALIQSEEYKHRFRLKWDSEKKENV